MAAILLLSFAGCGGGKYATHPVKGQVRFEDGSTPQFGQIEFYHSDAKLNARGTIESDGSFTVGTYSDGDGAIEGNHQIVIIQNTGTVLADRMGVEIHHDHGDIVDRSYFDYRTTSLSCYIRKGENTVELVVKKNPE